MFTERNRLASVASCIALTTAIVGVLQAGSVLAAESSAAGSGLQEIIVTAQRTETSLQRTPVSVTALTAEALEQRGVKNLLDVGNFTPNFEIGSRSGTGSNSGGLAIRGIGVDAGAQAAVGVYIDDVYYPSGTGNLLNLLDLDRIEVLRGPQGTLFGRNTIAGAVQYVTVKPSQTIGGFVQGSVGNLDTTGVRAALNVPLSEDLAVRLAVADDTNGGYVHDMLKDVERGEVKNTQYRAQLRWTPNDRLTLDVKAEGFKEETNGRAVEVVAYNDNALFPTVARFSDPAIHLTDAVLSTGDWQNAGFNAQDWFQAYYNEGQVVAAYKLNDSLTVKSITAYSITRTQPYTDIDDTPVQVINTQYSVDRTRFFTEELQLNGSSFEDRLKWTVGYYYYDTNAEVEAIGVCIGVAPCGVFGAGSVTQIKSNSVYGQGTFSFTDQLSLLVGLRYSKEDNNILNTSFPQFTSDETYTDTSPAIGLNFQATPDTLLYVKASKGFRGGGATGVSPVVSPTGFLAFDPETAWTYEAGVRWEFLDGRARLNPTVFYTDWKDLQFSSFKYVAQNSVATQNAGDAQIQGAELEAQFAVTDKFLLTGSASYLDGEYTRVEPDVQLTTDSELQRAPKYKFAVGGRYTQTLSNGARLVPSLDYSYTDEQRSSTSDVDSLIMPSYGLVNARISYDSPSGKWSVAAYGTNLANEHYLIGGVDFRTTPGVLEHDPGRPRQYGLDLRVNF